MPIDYKKYPPNWKTEIRPAILQRANNRCEVCGLLNGSIVLSQKINGKTVWLNPEGVMNTSAKKVKVVLTIAHLDHDELNHNVSLDRLKALCQLHHLQYDSEEKQRRKKSH